MSQQEIRSQLSQRKRVGIYLKGTDAADTITQIREAEDAGVEQIWMISGDAGGAEILTTFAAAVSQTRRITLGSAVLPIYPRHPLVMAQQMRALEDIAPGRLRLGIGPSHRFLMNDVYGLPYPSPLSYLKEYLTVLREALWEGNTTYQGDFFKVASSLRKAEVPLLTSAVGPKAFRLAGEIADGALSYMSPISYLLNTALAELQAGAEARQRPTPPLIAHIRVAMSTDDDAVLAAMRKWLQILQTTMQPDNPYARMLVRAGFAGVVSGDEPEIDRFARALVINGDETTVHNRLAELLENGLDELALQLIPIADEEQERKQLLHAIGSL
jgi:alkanesulfonate monooxygenase SsuD/methylene tetrahydromethanopterin reductase-like flavin-dependent oxidoreductase (luciferase family)